jgi:hypothetical protein
MLAWPDGQCCAALERGRFGRRAVERGGRRRGRLSHGCYVKDKRLWRDTILTEPDRKCASVVLSGLPACPPRINQAKRQSTDILQAGASRRRSGVRPSFNITADSFRRVRLPLGAFLLWSNGHVCSLYARRQTLVSTSASGRMSHGIFKICLGRNQIRHFTARQVMARFGSPAVMSFTWLCVHAGLCSEFTPSLPSELPWAVEAFAAGPS